MPSTALVFIPAPSGNSQPDNSASTLLTHILSTRPSLQTTPFTLEHKFLVETSSVLNPSASASRRFTHFLTLPHVLPGSTFIGVGHGVASHEALKDSEKPGESLSLSVIPSQPDTLFPLMMEKMKPLWLPRQIHRVENGASFELSDWRARVGDLRVSAGSQGQWRTRGCLLEVEFLGEVGSQSEMKLMIGGFVGALARDSDFGAGGSKIVLSTHGSEKDHSLVRQYMKLLDFPKT